MITEKNNAGCCEKKLGLSKDAQGNLYLGEKPFKGYGVNSFSAVTYYVDAHSTNTFEEQFTLLKSYNIPFLRVNFGGYWPEYYERFDKDPDAIISKMRDALDSAQSHKIGLICSLLWYDGAISYHVGEKRSAMGDPHSKTAEYTRKYVARIVNEFKDHPAVWGWEIGNEYNLDADLCDKSLKSFIPQGPATPAVPSGFDFYTSEELVTYMTLVAEEIRKYDPYRIISAGHGDMRDASKALHNAAIKHDEDHLWENDWTQDTIDDFYEMCAYFTPDPFDAMCFHIQHSQRDDEGNAYYLDTWRRFGKVISTKEYLEAFVNAAKKTNKVLYFGEFGDLIWKETAPDAPEYFDNLVNTCLDAGIGFASTWQFMTNNNIANDNGIDGEKLRILQKVNLDFIAKGDQPIDEYWN